MTATELVTELESLGVHIWEEDGELRFRAPRGVMTDDRRDAVRAHRDQVIEHLRRQAAFATITPAPEARFEPFPLTDVQSAYLLGRQDIFAYGGVGCQVYAELRLDDLDVARLEAAWNGVIRRHDMLRATIHPEGYQQVAAVVPHYTIALHEDAAALRDRLAHNTFAPDRWPLFELALTRATDHAVIHVAIDFLIADYMSVQLLLSELASRYHAPAPDTPSDLTFRDYVLAERGLRESAQYQRDRKYWTARIDTLPAAPALPIGSKAIDAPARFMRLQHLLDRDAWAGFRANAARHSLTPSVAVLAAYASVVARWSREDRFLLNLTLLNRQPLHADVHDLLGDFTTVNLLAVDAQHRDFATEARAVQAQLWQDMDHRLFSGIEVMRELARARGQDGAMMPVVFTSTIGLNESAIELGAPVFGLSQTPQVWLDCQAIEREDTLVLQWDIRRDALADGVDQAMFAAMADLLTRLSHDAGLWTQADAVALPADQTAQRHAANATQGPLPQGRLHDGFFAQAKADPQRLALIDAEGEVSYGDLAAQAGGIAAALRAQGCAVGDIVAIALPTGRRQVAAALGIHLTGAAYLPLDMGQPPMRRDAILADAGVRIVIGHGTDWPTGVSVIAQTPPAPPVDAGAGADALAYVIYTSGSTGAPKGVMIAHRAALNTVADINARMGMGPHDRVFGIANLNFDLSVYDMFGPLAVGAALVMPDPALRHDPGHWCDMVARHGVTLWNSVPAQMQMLLHVLEAEPDRTLPLARAMLSGDWIPLGLPAQLRHRLPDVRLYSLGGATEAAIWSNIHAVGEQPADWPSVPYGKPLTNQAFHILDAGMADCPDWVPGELYIGGAGLALGYMGDPDRTAQRFIDHPHSGQRLYRTGDMGRYRPGGVIEFLGREDSQVKIRGYRIELAEIEAALLGCDGIVAATALVEGDTPMDLRLAAFVQAAPIIAPAPTALTMPDHDPTESQQALDFTEALNTVARQGFHQALRAAGMPATGVWGDGDAVMTALRIIPAYRRLLTRWLHLLTEAGLLEQTGTQFASPALVVPDWDAVERARLAAGYADTIQTNLARALDQIGPMLRGEVQPTDVFFPNGDTSFAQAAYDDTLVGRRVNRGVIEAVRAAATDGEQLRVLEIGAGVGGTSAALIPALADLDVDYQFTDISRFFLNRAEQVFHAHPFVRYGTLDINESLREQDYSPNTVDAVVACNVLHYARDLPGCIAALGGLLRPGGQLVIVETIEEIAWTMASLEFLVGEGPHAEDEGFFRPEDVWAQLLADAAGEAATVLPAPHDPLHAIGQRVFVVRFKAGTARIDNASLQAQLADRLPAYMIPQRIEVVDALPVTPNGKIDRKTMRGWLAMGGSNTPIAAPEAMDPLEARLAEVWCSVLGLSRVGRQDNFFQIGGDSLLVSQLSSRLHESFEETQSLQFTQTMRQILRHPTIADLAIFLRKAAEVREAPPKDAAPASPVTPLGEVRGGPDLFLVHELGGTMAPWLNLINVLKPELPLFGLAVTKVALYLERDPAILIDTLADEYADLLAEAPPARLAGYGLGGLLAVAIASRLAERGVDMPQVTVIGSAGQTVDMHDDLAVERAFCRFIGVDPACVPDGLGAEDRLGRIAAALSADREGVDGLGYARAHLSLFRHSLAAYAAFRPNLFAGDLHLLLPQDPMPALPWLDPDTTAFWQGLCMGNVTVERISGNHFTCLKPPHVAGVAHALLQKVRT